MLKFRSELEDKVITAFRKALKLAGKIVECSREYEGLFNALSGGYVEPGPSGSITRGKIDILPTGRNFYAVDPTSLPTKAAWEIGVKTAIKMLNMYVARHGRYPESIGHILWSIDGYKADGEQLAQILYLLGVEPVWVNDSVRGIRVIPLSELGRPRIDVVVRISGIVRDTLPNYIYLIDEAVSKVVSLDEPLDMNYPKKHYVEHVSKLVELGRNLNEASKIARFRVFCSPPGSYGSGVNYAIAASAWKNEEDLAKTWIQWSSYAYSKDGYREAHDVLMLAIRNVDIVTRNHLSDEHDIFGCCCYFSYHGGFYNTVKALSGRDDIEIITVDTRDVSNPDIRDMSMEVERIARAKLLNPVWISEMKKHGYRGANEFSRKILHLYGWSATTRVVKDWIFNEIAKTYALNSDMRRWFIENNIYAFEEIVRRLIEAYERGIWRAPQEIINKLRKVYGEVEGILEESITSEANIQGGIIKIYTSDDVDYWKMNISKVDRVWRKLREG